MISQPHILVVGGDRMLTEEFEAAKAALRAHHPVLRFAKDFRQAIEAARNWRPGLALIDMGTDFDLLTNLAKEIHACAPETAVVGLYRPEVFASDGRENTILIEAYRSGVRDFLRRPVSSADLAELIDRLSKPSQHATTPLGKIVSVVSNKGGVGKSTLSVNLACGLAQRHPDQVLLIDVSVQLGTCASLLNLRPETSLTDVARQRDRLDETLIRQLAVPHSSGLQVLAAPPNAIEGVEITDEVLSRLLTLARRSYRYTIVDTFPVIDRSVVAAIDLSDMVYIVFENVVPTLLGVPRLVELLSGFGLPLERQQIVLNRYQQITGNPSQAEVARRLGRPVDHVIPYDRRIVTAANFGAPFILSAGRFNSSRRTMLRIVDQIEQLGHGTKSTAPIANGSPAASNHSPKITTP